MPRKPVVPDRPKLAPISFRTTERRREELDAKARAAGRSLSQEVERLLDLAISLEDDLGDAQLIEAISFISGAAGRALKDSEGPLTDPRVRARVIRSIHAATNLYLPLFALWKTKPELAAALQQIAFMLSYSIRDFVPSTLYALVDGQPLPDAELDRLQKGLDALLPLAFSNSTPEETAARVAVYQEKLLEAQTLALETQRSLLAVSPADWNAAKLEMMHKMDRWNAEMASMPNALEVTCNAVANEIATPAKPQRVRRHPK